MPIGEKDIREKLKDIDEFLLADYKKQHPEKKRDWRTYEEQNALRIKEAMQQLKPLVDVSVDTIQIYKGPGPRHILSLKQRVLLLLLQRLFGERARTKKYYSLFGIVWYELPKFNELSQISPISVELSREFLEQINEFNRNLAITTHQQTLDSKISVVKHLD